MINISIQIIDRSVNSDWWKNIVSHLLCSGDKLEIRCWREETEEIKRASLYGETCIDNYEVSIKGRVTEEFLSELQSEEPADKSLYNKMTKYFTINVKNERCGFSSAHYGTEMYLERLTEADASFVKNEIGKYPESFSISVY